MGRVKEVWKPLTLTASGRLTSVGGKIGGFLCTTAGTLQITAGETSGGATIVPVFDVAEGTYYPLPFDCADGAYAVLTTAQGVFAV